jgi:hypothetical protein
MFIVVFGEEHMKNHRRVLSVGTMIIILLLFANTSIVFSQIILKKRGDLAGKMENYLNAKGWTFTENESGDSDRTIFWVKFNAKDISYKSYFVTIEHFKWLNILSMAEIRVPEAKRQIAAEYLMRANYLRSMGCFDMDFSDGTVKYRIGVDVEGGVLSEKMIENMVIDSHAAMRKFIPGLLNVIFGEKKPEDVLNELNKE